MMRGAVVNAPMRGNVVIATPPPLPPRLRGWQIAVACVVVVALICALIPGAILS